MTDPLQFLRDLGTVDALMQAAQEGVPVQRRPGFNTHVHVPPNFSAFPTVADVIAQAAAQDVYVLGTGNYYDYSVYTEFAARAQDAGIFPLFGTEIIALVQGLMQQGTHVNDPGNPGRIYICGKGITGFTSLNDTAARLLGTIRHNDTRRMALMTESLSRRSFGKARVWLQHTSF